MGFQCALRGMPSPGHSPTRSNAVSGAGTPLQSPSVVVAYACPWVSGCLLGLVPPEGLAASYSDSEPEVSMSGATTRYHARMYVMPWQCHWQCRGRGSALAALAANKLVPLVVLHVVILRRSY